MRGCDQSERNANIAALLKQGLATKEIAATFDVSDGVVRDVAKKAGLKVKRELEQEARARLDALLRIAVWAMRGAGGSVEQIATVTNTTTNQVKLILETP
jgi:DNA-directed RNA polymerase specialized sigma24 family protein